MNDVIETTNQDEIDTKNTEEFVASLRDAFKQRHDRVKKTTEQDEVSHRIDNEDITFMYFKSKDRAVTYSDTKDTQGNVESMMVADQLPDGRIVLLYWRKGSSTLKYVQEFQGRKDEVVNLPGNELTNYINLVAPSENT